MHKEISDKVLEYVSAIPVGKVVTYGRIAKALKLNSPRFVGFVLHRNPDPAKYPCHRVVFADGSLSRSYAFGGMDSQRAKLESEGICFKGEKVDSRCFV